MACQNGHLGEAKALLAAGAKTDLLRKGAPRRGARLRSDGVGAADGSTPLVAAARTGNATVLQELLRAGARTDLRDHSAQTAGTRCRR